MFHRPPLYGIISRLISLVLLLFFSFPWNLLRAQEIGLPQRWMEMVEQWSEMNDEGFSQDEVEAFYEHYRLVPVNLNDTTGAGIAQFFFITPFQQAALHAYIAQRGALLSVEELHLIAGFDSITIEMLTPLVTIASITSDSGLHWRDFRYGHSNLLIGGSRTVERARGYKEHIYEGDPYRLYWRYRFQVSDKFLLQLSGDKDAGEALFKGEQRQGFDHYAATLMVGRVGPLRRLVVGNYNLQFGQGLTIWTGFAPYTLLGSFGYRAARGITPGSAFIEYGYLTGAAATVALSRHWEASMFFAYTPLDGTVPKSLSDSSIAGYGVVQSIYLNGMHRTETELAKRHRLHEQLYGGHLSYSLPNVKIGVTGYRVELDRYILPSSSYRYNYYYFRGHENYNVGIDGAYRMNNTLVYGELTLSQNGRGAMLVGVDRLFASASRVGVSYHRYDAWYWNLHAEAQSTGGYTRNEESMALTVVMPLPARFFMEASAAYSYYPEMRSTAYAASHATDIRLRLTRQISRPISAALIGRVKIQDKNYKSDSIYYLADAQRFQMQFNIQYKTQSWMHTLRFVSTYYSFRDEAYDGFLLQADSRWSASTLPLTITSRVALFQVDDYDARIYAVESGLAYDNSGVSYNHRGLRFYLVVHYDVTRHIALGVKYAMTCYLDGSTFGSSYTATGESHQQQWHLQMRFKF